MVVVGLVVEVLVAVAYVIAAARADLRGRRWPPWRTWLFLGGLSLLALALQSPLASYDDVPWVHNFQHVLLMGVAPPLLALGAPLTLAFRVLPPARARALAAVLHHPTLRSLCGSGARWHVAVDYYALTFIYVLTPLDSISDRHVALHVAVHVVLITCGLLFWVPVIGVDAAGWRPSYRTKVVLVGAGAPLNLVLAVAAGSWSVFAVTEAATLFGICVLAIQPRPRLVRRTIPAQRTARLQVNAGRP